MNYWKEFKRQINFKINHLLGGAGGKGTWGKLGCELELPWIDPNDPNYESDSEKADSPKEVNGKKSLVDCKPLVPEMSEEDVRKAVEPLILEYFENSDSMEVLFTLQVKKNQNGILLPKLFWPTVRKNCSIDWEKLQFFVTECFFNLFLEVSQM